MRSGDIHVNLGSLENAGINGYNWLSLASSKHASGSAIFSAFYFRFSIGDIESTNGPNNRWFGFPLRWLK